MREFKEAINKVVTLSLWTLANSSTGPVDVSMSQTERANLVALVGVSSILRIFKVRSF